MIRIKQGQWIRKKLVLFIFYHLNVCLVVDCVTSILDFQCASVGFLYETNSNLSTYMSYLNVYVVLRAVFGV